MGSPMRQPLDESGPYALAGSAKTRGEESKVQRITAISAMRMTKLGIQMRLRLGCMTFSSRARANDASRASYHGENEHAAIPCRFFGGEAPGLGGHAYRYLRLSRLLAAAAKATDVRGP